MATHPSILAWETHRQRSLVGYCPWGGKRVGHDLATKRQQREPFLPIFHIHVSPNYLYIKLPPQFLKVFILPFTAKKHIGDLNNCKPERLQSYQEHTYSLKQLWMRKDNIWTPTYLLLICYATFYTHESFKRLSEHTNFFLWDLVTFLKMQLVRFALLWETTELQLGRKIIQNKPSFTK